MVSQDRNRFKFLSLSVKDILGRWVIMLEALNIDSEMLVVSHDGIRYLL